MHGGIEKGSHQPGSPYLYVNTRCLCTEMDVVNEIPRFLALKSADLKKYLRERSVPVNDEKHGELAEKAFWAEKLGLIVKPTDSWRSWTRNTTNSKVKNWY